MAIEEADAEENGEKTGGKGWLMKSPLGCSQRIPRVDGAQMKKYSIMLKIIAAALAFCAIFMGCINNEDNDYWIKNREQLIRLSELVQSISSKSGIRYYTRTSVRSNLTKKDEVKLEEVSNRFPKYDKAISNIISSLASLNILACSAGNGYVEFFVKSGGLGSDTVLVNHYEDNGFREFEKDFDKIDYQVKYKRELEAHWTYVYVD